jgi:hypothetical protein
VPGFAVKMEERMQIGRMALCGILLLALTGCVVAVTDPPAGTGVGRSADTGGTTHPPLQPVPWATPAPVPVGPISGQVGVVGAPGPRDLVGPYEELRANGQRDAHLRLRLSAPGRTLTGLELRNTNGIFSAWDTIPGNGYWLMAVMTGWQLLHDSQGRLIPLPLPASGEILLDLYVEDNGAIAGGKTDFRLSLLFQDGLRHSLPVSLAAAPPAPPPAPAPTPIAGTNLARGKHATQSATAYGGEAQRAVDGNLDGNYAGNSVSHTDDRPQSWWQVDLGAVSSIQSVRLWNRTDCCAERLSRFFLFVSETPLPAGNLHASQNHQGVWAFNHDRPVGRTTDIPVNRRGRYVRIQLSGADYLHLAEVEVFGAAAAPSPQPPSPSSGVTWDFETGDLRGWTKTGTAFDAQPTFGDNPTARGRVHASKHQGHYWIGSYEKRPRAADPAGQVQGDGPQGTLTSQPFVIGRSSITFLIGGGCDANGVRVELLVDGQPVLRATGKCSESLERVRWDVSAYRGRTAQIRLVDASAGDWGHINFDDVRFE